MKKTIIPLTLILLLSIFAYTVEKDYSVHFTVPQWEAKLKTLESAKQLLLSSDLQTKLVVPVVDSISLLQLSINQQVTKQLNDTTKLKK